MPFLCALKFWLWLVWFLDLAISVACTWGEKRGKREEGGGFVGVNGLCVVVLDVRVIART
jgi:hypothetical protein